MEKKAKNVNKDMSEEEAKRQREINLSEILGPVGTSVRDAMNSLRKMNFSNSEIARRLNVSDGYISDIAKGNRPISHMTVATIEKMFPKSAFNSNFKVGDITMNNTFNINQVNTNAMKKKIIDLIEGIDVPAEAKIKVIRAIYEMEVL